MNRRNLWKYDETMELLFIMKQNNFPSQFSNKHNQNMQIFRLIEKQMTERGYRSKSGEQICVRWKNLKNLYQKVKRSNNKNEQDLFPYYVEMDELIGQQANKFSKAAGRDNDDGTIASERDETVEDGSEKARTSRSTVRTRVPKKRRFPYASSAVERTVRPVSKLEATLASSKQELSDEFYRTQKRLIDYEFNLYMRKEEELIGQLQETTRSMLEEYMDRFFAHLKHVVGHHGSSEQELTFVEIQEDHEEVL
uniref:Myb/SANT-like DNA-binding domain-containing protein n=1 Tax=Anopheles atroparvus TaxID=41427 RepID=A0A182JMB8_ANOAO